jgi:hypothetical protein
VTAQGEIADLSLCIDFDEASSECEGIGSGDHDPASPVTEAALMVVDFSFEEVVGFAVVLGADYLDGAEELGLEEFFLRAFGEMSADFSAAVEATFAE